MANISDIRFHISSIKQTRQITNAMYLVSASRMRKAMGGIEQNRAYFNRALDIMRDIREHTDFQHPYLTHRESDKTAFVIIAGEKGLSGSYNRDILTFAEQRIGESNATFLYTVGNMATNYFRRRSGEVHENFAHIAEEPGIDTTRRMVTNIMELYDTGQIDELRVIYTHFINPILHRPREMKLLPILLDSFGISHPAKDFGEEMFYEPLPAQVFSAMVPQFIIGYLYGTLVHSYASENCARMMAMESATKSADEVLEKLTRQYHSARQLAITNEISEIVGSASAFEEELPT